MNKRKKFLLSVFFTLVLVMTVIGMPAEETEQPFVRAGVTQEVTLTNTSTNLSSASATYSAGSTYIDPEGQLWYFARLSDNSNYFYKVSVGSNSQGYKIDEPTTMTSTANGSITYSDGSGNNMRLWIRVQFNMYRVKVSELKALTNNDMTFKLSSYSGFCILWYFILFR